MRPVSPGAKRREAGVQSASEPEGGAPASVLTGLPAGERAPDSVREASERLSRLSPGASCAKDRERRLAPLRPE